MFCDSTQLCSPTMLCDLLLSTMVEAALSGRRSA